MEKKKRIEASQLPEETIQHIQSFLSGKEAARTTILSKSWYTAWLTRPNIDFSEADIPSSFMNFGKKTMQRYFELNLKIESFKVSCSTISLAQEWTRKAIKLGATHIHVETLQWDYSFLLPHEVLQSESLVRLSLVGGKIDHHKVISCWRLKSLSLCRLRVDANIMWDVVSTCPLIEELVLSRCQCNYGTSSPDLYKSLLFIGVNHFHKLKVLSLVDMQIGECFFSNLQFNFPCLKDLTLKNIIGHKEIQICSNSLECIVFSHWADLKVKFDVPRIRKLKFHNSCVGISSISFKTTSREWEWESDISFDYTINTSSWFVKIREFLQELSSSKISLRLSVRIFYMWRYQYARMTGLPKPPTVEKLEFLMDAPISIVENLFLSCRPKFIILPSSPGYKINYYVVKLICNTLIGEECAMPDLKEVNVQVSERIVWTWSRRLPSSSKTLDASGCIETKVCLRSLFSWIDDSVSWGWTEQTKICLELRWG